MAAHANHLRAAQTQAVPRRAVLGAAMDQHVQSFSMQCQAFQVGALGNFPYYWQDPTNLKFNPKTYKWISAGLKACSSPVELDQPFTNHFIAALSKVCYSLSMKDKALLGHMPREVLTRQGALLETWQAAFGALPVRTGDMEPIDIIINKIVLTWASPPTNLEELQITQDLTTRLNRTPASGMAVLPALANYLNALQSTISLINSTTMNRGYLQKALAALQSPSLSNGAIETSDGRLRPAYTVSTPLDEILRGLNAADPAQSLTYRMSVQRSSPSDCSVVINFGDPDRVPIGEFLTIETQDGQDLFKNHVLAGTEPAQIELTFMGITTVNFGPVDFSLADMKNWYWTVPINQAIANEGKDITGFKFSPKPQMEFTQAGPFGFLTAVTISKKASLTITGQYGKHKEIAEAIQASPSVRLKFLNTPISTDVNDSPKYDISLSSKIRDDAVAINLNPSPEHAGDSLESTAFVLCVQTKYPSAG
jgi:hypothetical protein